MKAPSSTFKHIQALAGHVIFYTETVSSTNEILYVDLSLMPEGIYFYSISKSDGSNLNGKIVKI